MATSTYTVSFSPAGQQCVSPTERADQPPLVTRKFPFLEGLMLLIHWAAWLAIVVTLWVLSPRGKASDVLFSFTNIAGWPNAATATLVGILTAWSVFVGYDSSVHMSTFESTNLSALSWTAKTNLEFSGECKGRLEDGALLVDDSVWHQLGSGFHYGNHFDLLRWRCGQSPCRCKHNSVCFNLL